MTTNEQRISDSRISELLIITANDGDGWDDTAPADICIALRELQDLRSSGGACDSPLAAGDAFVAAFKREPKDPADLAWMNGYAAGRRAPEPAGQPPKAYRLQDRFDPTRYVEYNPGMWDLILIPQPLTKDGKL